MENLNELLKEFKDNCPDWYQNSNFSITERYTFFQNFFKKENLEKAEWKDFQTVGDNLHSLGTNPLAKARAFGKENHQIQYYRDSFEYLIRGAGSLTEKFNNLLPPKGNKGMSGVGKAALSELLCYAFPEDYVMYNSKTIDALRYLGIELEQKDNAGASFLSFNEKIKPLIDSYVRIVNKQTNTSIPLELDQFFAWINDTKVEPSKSKSEKDGNFFPFLKRFLDQAKTTTQTRGDNGKIYKGLKLDIRFGMSPLLNIPYMALLKDPNEIKSGIYPVYLLMKEKNTLILSYGVSASNTPVSKWPEADNYQTINEWYQSKYKDSPSKYGDSFIKAVYNLNEELDQKIIETDLQEIIDDYNSINFGNPTSGGNTTNTNSSYSNGKFPLNQILYGPPGTGKTYNTINKALEIVGFTIKGKKRYELKVEFDNRIKDDQILFTTFHQSMSYEDFIEGIKPDEPKLNQSLSYSVQPGIFKRACANAAYLCYKEYLISQNQTQSYSFDDLYDAFITNIQTQINNNKSPIFKTLRGRDVEVKEINSNDSIIARAKDSIAKSSAPLTKENLQKLYDKFKLIEDIEDLKQVKETVQITPRITEFYAVFRGLKEFEKTFKPNLESNEIGTMDPFEKQKKFDADVFYDSIIAFGKKAKPVVFIIDEINRGNVSQIFGELITLIEEDKRLGKTEAINLILPYSKKKFSVPPNLYIIGTMNTADRSVEALDTALRRRFDFIEMPPVYSKLDGKKIKLNGKDFTKLKDVLETINDRLKVLLTKDHQIGHSYFLKINSNTTIQDVFKNNIIPLLQEYFYGDFAKICMVLGESFISKTTVKDNVIKKPFFAYSGHDATLDYEEKEIWTVKEEIFNAAKEKEFAEAIENLLNPKVN
jgi:5-methylcytosine-specific restriction endonuclease McrBC GTP-binding regulatory subunit McrB